MTAIPVGDAIALTHALVAIDSRNPSLVAGAPGERECAERLVEVLRSWQVDAWLQPVEGRRANVVARAGPVGVAPLVFNGHLDVVGTEAMTHPPFVPVERDGRLYGRGSCDMKGGVAAMCAAVARAVQRGSLAREVWITAVVDEEWMSSGTAALLAAWQRPEAGMSTPTRWPVGAIITEPTALAICPAHKGFEWLRIELTGRAAHGSRHDLGVDAIVHAGLVLASLEQLEREELPRRTHPLLGRASVHAAEIQGGTGLSTYPDRCVLTIERRTLPGETAREVRDELQGRLDRIASVRPTFRADVTSLGGQPPSDVDVSAPIVRALAAALDSEHHPIAIAGMSAWTDAALFNAAGIPAICFGPGDIALAHAATEWVPTDDIERATRTLERLLTSPDSIKLS